MFFLSCAEICLTYVHFNSGSTCVEIHHLQPTAVGIVCAQNSLSLNDGKCQLSQKTRTAVYFESPFPQEMVQVFFYDVMCKACLAVSRLRLIHFVSLVVN